MRPVTIASMYDNIILSNLYGTALVQYLALTTSDILPYRLDNIFIIICLWGKHNHGYAVIIIMLFALRGCAITLVLCDMEKYHHGRKWIRQCIFSMEIELSSVLGIIMIIIIIVCTIPFLDMPL